jgi:DNA-binding transcriptional LysR family regulator
VASTYNSYSDTKKITLEELSNEKLILTEKECQYHKAVVHIFNAAELIPHILLETGNTEIIKKFVETNNGLSVLPEITVRNEIGKGELVKLDTDIKFPKVYIHIAFHKSKWKSSALDRFLQMAQEHFKEYNQNEGIV